MFGTPTLPGCRTNPDTSVVGDLQEGKGVSKAGGRGTGTPPRRWPGGAWPDPASGTKRHLSPAQESGWGRLGPLRRAWQQRQHCLPRRKRERGAGHASHSQQTTWPESGHSFRGRRPLRLLGGEMGPLPSCTSVVPVLLTVEGAAALEGRASLQGQGISGAGRAEGKQSYWQKNRGRSALGGCCLSLLSVAFSVCWGECQRGLSSGKSWHLGWRWVW